MYKSVHIDHWAYAVQAKVPSAGHYDQELPGTQSSPRGASSASNTRLYSEHSEHILQFIFLYWQLLQVEKELPHI